MGVARHFVGDLREGREGRGGKGAVVRWPGGAGGAIAPPAGLKRGAPK